MHSRRVTVMSTSGLHARPAAVFVRAAAAARSTVLVRKDGREASAKSLITLLLLGVHQGDEVEVVADGPDEVETVDRLVELLSRNLDEEGTHP
ncbi:MAG: HPr family phosphocarrier protein [Protaetiibacter sp.]